MKLEEWSSDAILKFGQVSNWSISYIKVYGNSFTSLHHQSLEIWVDQVLCGKTTVDPGATATDKWYGVLCNNGKSISGSTIKVK